MTAQTISLCMIAKNEEKYLEHCLNSVKDLVDEIIIIDTGSTDKTKEIAKKFNAKVYDFKWVDDFSAARNESLKHATKDWILVLDADEALDKEALKVIKEELIKNKENDAFLFIQKNYTNDTKITGFVNEEHKFNGKTYAGWYGSFIARLFRNNKDYKFQGTVHELVEPSIESKKRKIAATNIPIYHYGNSDPSVVKRKREFYLELCRKKAKSIPNANSYFELGVLYRENEDKDDAIKSLKKAIGLDSNHNMALYELGIIYEQKKDYDEAIKHYTGSLRIRENTEAFQSLGVCYLKKGMLKEAYRNLAKALMLNPNKYTIYNNLGAVLERNKNYDTAIQMLEIGIKLNPKNVIGYYNLGLVYDRKGEFGKALENYEKAVELGHSKKEEINKRISQIKAYLIQNPNIKYGFKTGG
ncbi:tetratricopeptide repeat protein [Candidatus Woesearchaeota archaeon]|nr:tetratricopeptide repeat protein [Candidatus Woesearchaeota archaeon]